MPFLYHVTYYGSLASITEEGLVPGAEAGRMGKGGYAAHSSSRIFLSDEDGVFFWHSRAEEHAEADSDDPLEDELTPVVLRIDPDEEILDALTIDEPGSRDAPGEAYYVADVIEPELLEVWDGGAWVPIEDWRAIDPVDAYDFDEDEGVTFPVFKMDSPLFPPELHP